jgi:hypothetical protein
MLRYALAALAAAVLVGASLIPDDAFARRGGGGYRGGGYHGGGAHYRGARFMPAVTTAVAMRLRDAAMDIVTR